MAEIVAEAVAAAGVRPVLAGLPDGVEATRRGEYLFLLNHGAETVSIPVPPMSASCSGRSGTSEASSSGRATSRSSRRPPRAGPSGRGPLLERAEAGPLWGKRPGLVRRVWGNQASAGCGSRSGTSSTCGLAPRPGSSQAAISAASTAIAAAPTRPVW